MFRDREDAARRLAGKLKGRELHAPLVLAVPRGGVVTGAVLARELGAELDVVLSRKLRAPGRPEVAVGAVAENGRVYLDHLGQRYREVMRGYLARERRAQLAEIARRRQLLRGERPPAPLEGRSVIVADDGVATGATLIAALQCVKARGPREVIVAVPVAPPDSLGEARRWCDDVVCLLCPEHFGAVSQFYEDFRPVEDEQVVELLRQAAADPPPGRPCAGEAARFSAQDRPANPCPRPLTRREGVR
jgi:predicted phosphoribosyltransferase